MLDRDDLLGQNIAPVVDVTTTPVTPHPVVTEQTLASFAGPATEETTTPAAGMEPVRADDKRVVNGLTDINQLAPFKYPWA